MNKKLLRAIVFAAVAGTSSIAGATEGMPPWTQDFEQPELLTVHFRCDDGSEYKSYLGPTTSIHLFTGITIKWRGGTFYVYSPNPKSMSPVTFNYVKVVGEPLKEVSVRMRDATLEAEAPLLYKVMSRGDAQGCTIVLDGSQREPK